LLYYTPHSSSQLATILWGSQSWLQPAFQPACGDVKTAAEAKLPATHEHHQNLTRSVALTARIALATFGSPNCALVTIVFQLGNVTWFSALVESNRKSIFP
jgi:hypothetical protein